MGLILSRFRRKKTSLEELEIIEEKIQDIELYRQVTEQQQKSVVGKLVIYSVGVYVLAATLFYFCFFPASLRDRLFYIIPLIIFPVIVVLVKKLISWFYVRRMSKQQGLLQQLKSDKRKILDNVMEKETYRVARTILEKFAPDQLRSNRIVPPGQIIKTVPVTNGAGEASADKTALVPLNAGASGSELRHRTSPGVNRVILGSPQNQILPRPQLHSQIPMQVAPRPRPVLPREPGFLDRLVEGLVGDGPSRRYALICSNCHGHNGMALREEFSFLSYRCCYCTFYNHAMKQRPVPPRIMDKEEIERKADLTTDSESDATQSDFEEIRHETQDCASESGVEMSPQDAEIDETTQTITVNSKTPTDNEQLSESQP